jgi:seryl-tRNA synthetase
MHDIKAIRQDPAAFDKAMARRGLEPQSPPILALDEERRAVQTELQTLQTARNEKSKEIGHIKGKGEDAAALMEEVAAIKDKMTALEERERGLATRLHDILCSLPNVQDITIPDGKDEHDNVELRRVGEPKRLNAATPDHVAIGEGLRMMDFETAAKMSGSRFVLMHSGLARLERALAQFMLDTHTTEHGYIEVSPPLLVNDQTMFGTGQLPKFRDDQFQTTRGDWLVPTAEVPLTNIVADMILEEEELPRRYTAFTPCFRQEAGAAGKDTRGMIRQHQFYKVELVSITRPEDSAAEHERMTACAENILKKLDLPFRTIVLCTGDAGFSSHKTYDIEVWLPGQEKYREISSCSNCGDFQARRMNARCRAKGDKATRFVHTLNGSGVAVGRALIAVLENYVDPSDGGVFVPDALKPYMGGLQKILKP